MNTIIDLKSIAENPGCYLFKDSLGTIIYIGKAKNLKKRVTNYFQKKDHDPKTLALVKNIHSADFMLTDTEVEALLLENTLIKRHQPKYNIDLKGSSRYAYLQVTDEEFPRILVAREKSATGTLYGPFVSGDDRNNIKDAVIRTFKLCTCKRFPKRACLRYHLGLCTGPCTTDEAKKDYLQRIENARKVLDGHIDTLISTFEGEMKVFSKRKNYEKALEARNQISSLMTLKERQKVERDKKYDENVITYIVRNDKVYLIVFMIHKGTLAEKREFVFDEREGFFEEFLTRYYSENEIPREVIIPETVSDALASFLNIHKKVIITVPRIGEKKQLLMLARRNIERIFFADERRISALQKSLNLADAPRVIECFDIAHISGTSTVGSMVRFTNGAPDKNNYRRFKIRTVTGVDDFRAIAEVVRRRYSRLQVERSAFPDLIVVDGGKGQLSAAQKELERLGLKIPIVSLAKRDEEVFVPGMRGPLKLDKKSDALHMLQQVRDEAHRFAQNYYKILHRKEMEP